MITSRPNGREIKEYYLALVRRAEEGSAALACAEEESASSSVYDLEFSPGSAAGGGAEEGSARKEKSRERGYPARWGIGELLRYFSDRLYI